MDNRNRRTRVARTCLCLFFLPMLAVQSLTARAQEFGTLFTSPEEREYLDYLREENLRLSQQNNFNIQEAVIPDIPVVQDEEPEPGPSVIQYKFGGIMERRNGSRMVWLNGVQVAESDLPDNMSLVEADGSTLLSIRAEGSSYRLKPGQTADLVANRVLEPFQQTPGARSAQPAATPAVPAAPETEAQAPLPTDTPSGEATVLAGNDGEQEPADLTEILESLYPGEDELSEEQIQRALEVLTEQANTTE